MSPSVGPRLTIIWHATVEMVPIIIINNDKIISLNRDIFLWEFHLYVSTESKKFFDDWFVQNGIVQYARILINNSFDNPFHVETEQFAWITQSDALTSKNFQQDQTEAIHPDLRITNIPFVETTRSTTILGRFCPSGQEPVQGVHRGGPPGWVRWSSSKEDITPACKRRVSAFLQPACPTTEKHKECSFFNRDITSIEFSVRWFFFYEGLFLCASLFRIMGGSWMGIVIDGIDKMVCFDFGVFDSMPF